MTAIDPDRAFCSRISARCQADNGAAAGLRRDLGRGPDRSAHSHRIVIPALDGHAHTDDLDAYYLTAQLIATFRATEKPQRDLGALLATAANTHATKVSTELMIIRLSRASLMTLTRHVPAAIRFAGAAGTPDWAQLLGDLRRWPGGRDQVGARWLRSYYRNLHSQPSADQEDQ